MAISQAQKKASYKWNKEHYEYINIRLNKGDKDKIKQKAEAENKSINQFILDRITV